MKKNYFQLSRGFLLPDLMVLKEFLLEATQGFSHSVNCLPFTGKASSKPGPTERWHIINVINLTVNNVMCIIKVIWNCIGLMIVNLH